VHGGDDGEKIFGPRGVRARERDERGERDECCGREEK